MILAENRRRPLTSIPEEFIRSFQIFDKEGNGTIGAGELRYVLTQLGEKMSDEDVDELMRGIQIGP
jgi:calmodulin